MNCYICHAELKKELILTANDMLVLGVYVIVIKNTQLGVCSECWRLWNKVMELLLSRFKEQKYIDEAICKKILEENAQ